MRKNRYRYKFREQHKTLLSGLRFISAVLICFGFIGFLSCGFIFMHDFITQCAYFAADRIEISGLEHLTQQQILTQAQLQPGRNILSINLTHTRKRLLRHSWIKGVEIKRKWPTNLFIKINEYKSLAILDLGHRFVIDTEGYIFKVSGPDDPNDLPLIKGVSYAAVNHKHGSFKAVMDVLKLGKQIDSILPNRFIRQIQVDQDMGLTLMLTNNPIKLIKLGYNDYTGKYQCLKNIILHLKNQNFNASYQNISVDVKNIHRVVVSNLRKEV